MTNVIDRKFKILSIFSLGFLLSVCFICYFFPNLQFNKPEYNRAFGLFMNLYCFYIFVILLKLFLKIKTKILKAVAVFLNVFFLLIAALNFLFYSMKLDPEIQYYDVEVIYFNNKNKHEKIIYQYYINWKTNQKIYKENRVYDIGPFRYFIEYDIDSSKLDNDWEKINKNAV